MIKQVSKFIKDMVPVLSGVLIAMWINNWNEMKKDKEYLTQMHDSIKKELRETQEEIREDLTYQKRLIDSLDFYKSVKKVSIFDIMMKVDGIHLPSIKINSWRAISRSKIELLAYDRLSRLANIEEQKELLESKAEYLINYIYPNIKETGSDKKELIILMMRDIIVTEKGIQEEIQAILSE